MFRFTIRDVLWLTVVVALGTGWAIERRRSNAQVRRVHVVEVEAQNGRMAIKRLHDDLERIEQELRSHGLTIAWSDDFRPTVQPAKPGTSP